MRLSILLLGILGVNPLAGQGLKPFQASDVFDLEFAADPQVSPDGNRVVYVRQTPDPMTDRTWSTLWVVNADGTGHRPLTTGKFTDAWPRWSPDGSRLLYLSDRGGSTQIHVMWLDTGRTQQVTSVERPPVSPAWSPDGRTIAFTMAVPDRPAPLAVLPGPPPGAEWAPPARVIDQLIYRFDQVGDLTPGTVHLFIVPAEGGTARQLTSAEHHLGATAARRRSGPVWSPDGRSILVAANTRAEYVLEPRDTDIFAFDAATGAARRLTDRRGPDDDPAVSPDGRLVAYTGYDDRKLGYQVARLYVMNTDGSARRELLADFGRDVTTPQWTADGTGLVFQSESEGVLRLFHVSLRGGTATRLADSVGSGSSAYTGGSFSLSRSGRIAYTWGTPSRAGDVAVDGLGDRATQILTALNEDVFSQRAVGLVEEIWYPSSKDGRPIHGWIIKPPGFDPGKKYPLLLEIHGGPFAAYGPKFDIEKQVWAGAGYVVLYTNPRGSTSYGEDFAGLIHHAYPGDDRLDLESGVDALVAKGYIDPAQLYVTGGSGGGVLTGWLIGHTSRYRAAVAQYPVVNWYSFALTTDIPYTTQYWFPGLPWEHQDQYMARSIISKIGAVTTPTMVITGESDWRTPMSESEQYFQALKLKGVPSALVRVPGEFHGIRGRPSHFMQKIGYIQAWFDRYRKPAA